MSTTATVPTTQPAFTFTGGNKFLFHDAAGTTQITFLPMSGGPITTTPGSGGPSLTYDGPTLTHTFLSPDMQMQSSPIGVLITVVLKVNDDTGGETLTLIVPPVNRLNATGPVPFETIALMGKQVGFIEKPGARVSCSATKLHGMAENVMLPL
jgi:hypothetical protein